MEDAKKQGKNAAKSPSPKSSASVNKATAKKTATKKATVKKTAVKKTATKKTATKKTAAKKTTHKKPATGITAVKGSVERDAVLQKDSTVNDAQNLYAVLGVEPTADADEIRKSYYRRVRQYPPEKFPNEFKKIHAAWQTLSSPEQRRSYDAMQQHGDKISKWMKEGLKAFGDEQWQEALKIFKKVIAVDMSNDLARDMLAQTFFVVDDYDNAIIHKKHLVDRNPENIEYLQDIGYIYLARYNSGGRENEKDLAAAKTSFNKVISLDPRQSGAFHALARISLIKEDIPGALRWLDKAIDADGKLDSADFDFLFLKLQVLVFNKLDKVEQKKTLAILNNVMVTDEERGYTAYRFFNLAIECFKDYDFPHADSFSYFAADFAKGKEFGSICEFNEVAATYHAAQKQSKKFMKDDDLFSEVKILAITPLDSSPDEEKQEMVDNSLSEIQNFVNQGSRNAQIALDNFSKLLSRYPAIWDLNPEFLDSIRMELARMVGWNISPRNEKSQTYSKITTKHKSGKTAGGNSQSQSRNSANSRPKESKAAHGENSQKKSESHHNNETTKQHVIQGGKCINCGCTEEAILHFHWTKCQGAPKADRAPKPQQKVKIPKSVPYSAPATNNTNSSDGCFVATAVYGDYEAPQVLVLRQYRDATLRQTVAGRLFIRIYYAFGPRLARIVGRSALLRRLFRNVLDRIVAALGKNK